MVTIVKRKQNNAAVFMLCVTVIVCVLAVTFMVYCQTAHTPELAQALPAKTLSKPIPPEPKRIIVPEPTPEPELLSVPEPETELEPELDWGFLRQEPEPQLQYEFDEIKPIVPHPLRTWTDKDGTRLIAWWKSKAFDKITLVTFDGAEVIVDEADLCQEDLDYIEQESRNRMTQGVQPRRKPEPEPKREIPIPRMGPGLRGEYRFNPPTRESR